VLTNWEAIKATEKAGRGALDGVPRSMPALLRATRVGEKASRVGFDWPELSGARAKVDEELAELDVAVQSGEHQRITDELGDVLFALVSVARKLAVDPEAALRGTLDRFTQRFRIVESLASAQGVELSSLSGAVLDDMWREAKARE